MQYHLFLTSSANHQQPVTKKREQIFEDVGVGADGSSTAGSENDAEAALWRNYAVRNSTLHGSLAGGSAIVIRFSYCYSSY